MTIDLLLEVGHATVADLDCVTVEDFVEHMIFRELFVEDFKECSSNVGSHVLAKRWVIPNDVSVAVPCKQVSFKELSSSHSRALATFNI